MCVRSKVRAGEGESEAENYVLTNPVAKTSMSSGLSQRGKMQVPDLTSHRIASHRIASHRIASHRAAQGLLLLSVQPWCENKALKVNTSIEDQFGRQIFCDTAPVVWAPDSPCGGILDQSGLCLSPLQIDVVPDHPTGVLRFDFLRLQHCPLAHVGNTGGDRAFSVLAYIWMSRISCMDVLAASEDLKRVVYPPRAGI
jgi:hypothetical protein